MNGFYLLDMSHFGNLMLPFLIQLIERFICVYTRIKRIHSNNCDSENSHVNQFDNPVTVSTDMLL